MSAPSRHRRGTGRGGMAVHDRFASYRSRLPEEADHSLCNAHLLRNLEEIVEPEEPGRTHAATAFKARDALLKPVPDCYENRSPPVRGHNLTRVQRTEREACLRFIAASLPCPIPTIRCSLALHWAKLHLSEIALAFRRQERLPLGPALDNIQGCVCLRQICCLLPGRAQSCPYFARESSGFQHG